MCSCLYIYIRDNFVFMLYIYAQFRLLYIRCTFGQATNIREMSIAEAAVAMASTATFDAAKESMRLDALKKIIAEAQKAQKRRKAAQRSTYV